MLRDKNGKWVKNLKITEELWKKSIQETLNGIIKLLESAEKLLQNGGDEAICAGLYTFAIEEYGKLLSLKQYSPSNGKVNVEFRDIFRGHKRKFEVATQTLPHDCAILHRAPFDPKMFDPNIFDTEDVIADFEARKAVFYCDFTDSGDAIKPVPPVNRTLLKNAINKFRTIALGTNVNV